MRVEESDDNQTSIVLFITDSTCSDYDSNVDERGGKDRLRFHILTV
jgi:hypothetical protein